MATITLSYRGETFQVIVDDEHLEYLQQWKWRVNNNRKRGKLFYCFRDAVKSDGAELYRNGRTTRQKIWMHRVVWEMHAGTIPSGKIIDHINGNGLDNRFVNLRLASIPQNNCNRNIATRIGRGIFLQKGVYRVRICCQGKTLTDPAKYSTLEEAKHGYNRLAAKLHGRYAKLHPVERSRQLDLLG